LRIQERIEEDLKKAIQSKDKLERDNLKVIISELQRQKTKVLTDEATIYILQTLKGWEEDRLIATGQEKGGSNYLDILMRYIPENMRIKELNEETIKKWIKENIDLSKYKYKFASIKEIKSKLGPSADGHLIKKIITEM